MNNHQRSALECELKRDQQRLACDRERFNEAKALADDLESLRKRHARALGIGALSDHFKTTVLWAIAEANELGRQIGAIERGIAVTEKALSEDSDEREPTAPVRAE